MKKLILLTIIFVCLTANAQNIALNKPATSSSVENTTYLVNYINDGNASTRWSSSFADNQWIQIDLGNTYNLTGCKISWEDSKAKSYTIQISNDAAKWTTIYTYSNNSSATNNLSLTGSGRYIKINCLVRSDKYGFSIWEFEVYGALAGNCNYTPYQTTIDSFKTALNNSKAQIKLLTYSLDTLKIRLNNILNPGDKMDSLYLASFKTVPITTYLLSDTATKSSAILTQKIYDIVPAYKLQTLYRLPIQTSKGIKTKEIIITEK